MKKIKSSTKSLAAPKLSRKSAKTTTKRDRVKSLEKDQGKNQNQRNSTNGGRRFPKITVKRVVLTVAGFALVASLSFSAIRWQQNLSSSYSADGTQLASACVDILNPDCWTTAFKPKLRQTNGETHALIVGIDTRESGSGSGLKNTDTIILATIDNDTGETRLISFPRDLYAPYSYTEDGSTFFAKINSIYAAGSLYAPDKDGIRVLKDTIKRITGVPEIHYHGIVRLEGVVEAVDALGGITINVEEDYSDVYPYIELPPELQETCVRARSRPGFSYCVFDFPAGETELDGDLALIYARMRYWSNDFERSRRQQQVISAIKDKVIGEDVPVAQKAQNLFEVYNSLGDKIEVTLDLETILASLDVLETVDSDPISIVLDPEFGGGGFIFAGEGSNYNFRDYTFAAVQTELNRIEENRELFKDQAKIYAVNRTGVPWQADNPIIELRNRNFWFIDLITDTKSVDSEQSGVVIIDQTGGNDATVAKLQADFAGYENVRVATTEEAGIDRTTEFEENVTVVIYSLTEKAAETTEAETGAAE